MNARREAKYRAVQNQIVNAKINRLSKIACAGLTTFSVGYMVFYWVVGYEKTVETWAKSPVILENFQSVLNKTFDKMYEVMNVGVSFTDEKDHIIPTRKPIVLD